MNRLHHISQAGHDADERLSQVEAVMQRYARGGRVDRMGAMALEQLATGGRRFRARLALLACDALGVGERNAVQWAAAVELLHNATLIHDDIQDQDTTRRGCPTLWVKHGCAQAINAGDFMLMLPHLVVEDMASPVRAELGFAVARAATRTVRGQAGEMGLRPSGRFDWDSYLTAAEGKTGALLALPMYGALRLAGRSAAQAERIAELYVQLGVLFQLQDDLVDLFGDKGRGEVGCDVYEGKVSALVVAQLERSPRSRSLLLEILDRPRAETTQEDVQLLTALFERSGARDAVLSRISGLRSRILDSDALANEPQLWKVTDQLVSLTLAPVAHLLPPRNSQECPGQRLVEDATA
jgi:geranylgeranyl diphosphate synthase, type I